jgi:hypothetical protein
VHLQRLDSLSVQDIPASTTDLQRFVQRLRWRLGFERVARFAIRGTIAGSLILALLAAAVWFTNLEQSLLWLAAAPALAALLFAVVRWPSSHETGVLVDRQFALQERLSTAVELAQAQHANRFSALQLQDALAHARTRHGSWIEINRRTGNEAVVALATLAMASLVVVLVPRIPRPVVTAPPGAEPSIEEVAPSADDLTPRALPLDVAEEAFATPVAAKAAAASPDLAARVQQEQAERSALDKLAQALGAISAGQPAADAIQQADFNTARDQLQNLADNADQLTDAAKQQLGRGLQDAASSTAQADRALANREQQAAQALARSNYADQRQALSALADQVQRSGTQSVPSDQLERDLGQLQQDTGAPAQEANATNSNSAPSSQSAANQPGAGQGDANQAAASGAQGQGTVTGGQNGNGAGDQNGTGVGTGTDPNLYADQPSRLDSSGQQVQVPLKLGNGPGVRPSDANDDQTLPNPELGGRTTSELAQTQQTGQVAPEQNLVPGQQRPVVRGYFR